MIYKTLHRKLKSEQHEHQAYSTTDNQVIRFASYLELHLEIDREGRLRAKHYDKRDDFNFSIVDFPFMCSNIPAATAYVGYFSHQWDRCDQRNHQI
jgi:hypothetical protein